MSGPRDREPDELALLGEPPLTPDERARAAALGRLVDDMLDGRPAPPALDAGQRALLETATSVHASLGEVGLPAARARSIVDSVLGPAPAGVVARRPTTIPPPRPASVTPLATGAAPLARPRRVRPALARVLPWSIASVCAAAALALWLRSPGPTVPAAGAPATLSLRSPDAVLGAPIAREQAAEASARIDVLVADRRRAGRGGQ